MTKYNEVVIEAAIEGWEHRKQRADEQIAELRAQLSGIHGPPAAAAAGAGATLPASALSKPRRKFSQATREAMSAAQRERWRSRQAAAAAPPEVATGAAPVKAKAKRRLSDAGRKAIADATKRRWAAYNAQKGAKKNPPKKGRAKGAVA